MISDAAIRRESAVPLLNSALFFYLCYSLCKLIGTGCLLEAAGYTGALFDYLINGQAFDKLRNALEVAVASAGKAHICHASVIAAVKCDGRRAGPVRLIAVGHGYNDPFG